ncbi:MAG: carboxypeptidase regulatory-like domain-containing protein [Myxococcota bacterium]
MTGLAIAACGQAGGFEPSDALEAAVSFEAQGTDLQSRFRPDPDGQGYVLDDVAADETVFDRVAFMVDSESRPTMDVRVFRSEDGWSAWQPAVVTFSEGLLHNAHVDLPEGGTHVQVRLQEPRPEDLSFMLLEGFVAVVEGETDDQGMGSRVQALAADDAVDVSRSGWNARPSRCSSRTTFTRITVHHTATPSDDRSSMPARMRQMQSYHMDNRGYCDIGYHFLIGQDGKVYQGREESLLGGHVKSNNSRNAGVSFIGTYTSAPPSQAMMSAGARVLSAISCHYDIALSSETVKGHRDYAPGNECPGSALYPRLSDLISAGEAGACGAGGAEQTTPPPAEADPVLLQGVVHESGDADLPIPGARVTVSGREAISDGDGRYSLRVVPGTHTIAVVADGYQPASLRRQVEASGETWISVALVPAQESGSRGNLVGVIYEEPNSSHRISGATVRLSNGSVASTNSNGYFSIEAPAGTYTMTVSASGYQTASASRQIRSGTDAWGCLGLRPLEARGRIVGVVHEEPYTNRRISGALVSLSGGQSTYSGSDGSFSFEVAPGSYRITAAADGFTSRTVVRTVENGDEAYAAIALSEAAAPTGELVGVVYASPDMAERIEGARVWTSTGQSTYTGADGIYTLQGVPAGQVSVYAGKDGYLSGAVERGVEAGSRSWASIPLVPGQDEEQEEEEAGIVVVSPTGGEATGSDPEFVWENISEEQAAETAFSYHLVVVSEDGVEHFEGSAGGQVGGESRTTIGLSLDAGSWLWAVYAVADEGDILASSAMHEFEVQ